MFWRKRIRYGSRQLLQELWENLQKAPSTVREGKVGCGTEARRGIWSAVQRELWRVQYALSRIRNAARELLTLDEKNPRRIFEGEALLRRMFRYGLLEEGQNKLDYVLALTVENFLERRLQTQVFKSGMAKSIHHARVLIRQRHIRVGRQVVNIPSFMVRVDSAKHIDFSLTSPFGGGRPGRVKRKNQRAAAKKAAGDDGDEDED
ncbi:hypothetical protein HPP92_015875 [Vanilla planifolia]|uniref:30S ribosomal protein S4, chloroplastic n=1 Tax=Vanilla planifolia TaxID=51239 RepID=A0A835URB1_VANPL|nr:hypothetical protein HPP92_016480 [Vanilla planifolia]KAG0471329.1 hypothetical protein HPP92_015875 [Vanilla planifolia]